MGSIYRQFSLEERSRIARFHGAGQSIREIAATLGRAPSSVSRELKRNSGAQIGYRPSHADDLAWSRRWRGSRMERHPALREQVLSQLSLGWSPEQIAGRMAREKAALTISHESIYRFIYAQITRHNDYRWRHYLPQAKSKRGRGKRRYRPIEHIYARVPISQRPAHILSRKQPGHWEVDLLHPSKHGAAVLVAVERTSRLTLLAKQSGKHAEPTSINNFENGSNLCLQPCAEP